MPLHLYDNAPRMIGIIIICISLIGHEGGGDNISNFATAAAPSGSTLTSRGRNNESYRRNEDIPIMGGHLPRHSRGSGPKRETDSRRPKRLGRNRKSHSMNADVSQYDASDDNGDEPPLFFSDHDGDDQWSDQHEYNRKRHHKHQPIDSFRAWALKRTGIHIPRVSLNFDPITTLKIRKSWPSIVPGAIIRVGADFETHRLGRGLWKLRGCIEDKLIGGRFTIKERKHYSETGAHRAVLTEYSKSWLFAGVVITLPPLPNIAKYTRIYGYPFKLMCCL